MDVELRAIEAADEAPSLSKHLERKGTLDQFLEFVAHRSAYQLKEADPHSWALPRLHGIDPHGTGCAFAASLAARLGRGEPLSAAVRGAKAYVHRAITAAGGGPLVHAVPPDPPTA